MCDPHSRLGLWDGSLGGPTGGGASWIWSCYLAVVGGQRPEQLGRRRPGPLCSLSGFRAQAPGPRTPGGPSLRVSPLMQVHVLISWVLKFPAPECADAELATAFPGAGLPDVPTPDLAQSEALRHSCPEPLFTKT